MYVHATFEAFDTITNDEDVARLRGRIGKQLQEIIGSGKMIAGGHFTDKRGGFFLFEVDSHQEVFEMLGSAFYDHCHLEVQPVISFEALGEFFQKHPVG